MARIYHLFNIKTNDPQAVYDALTTQEGLAGWWAESCTLSGTGVGATATFRFSPAYGKQMKVTGLEPGRKVEWECVTGDPQWLGTRCRFSIEPKEGSVDVRFEHDGWQSETYLFARCNYHWGLYMKSLKALVETGAGNPHPAQEARAETN